MPVLTVVPKSARAGVQTYFETSLRGWVKKWFADHSDISFVFTDQLFEHLRLDSGDSVFTCGQGQIVIKNARSKFSRLVNVALQATDEQSINQSDDFVTQFSQALQQSLLEAVAPDVATYQTDQSDVAEYFPSALMISVTIGEQVLVLKLTLSVLKTLNLISTTPSKTNNELVNRSDSVSASRVTLKASLNPSKMSLQELVSIAPGDVIKLEHKLEQPIHIEAPGGTLPVKAFLVKQGTKKALILTK